MEASQFGQTLLGQAVGAARGKVFPDFAPDVLHVGIRWVRGLPIREE
jgi:hypothetical protein